MRALYVRFTAAPCSKFTFLAILAFLLIALSPAIAQTSEAQSQDHPLTAQEWREDLHYLAAQMQIKHKSLFHTMTEVEFTQAVAKLDADIPGLHEDQVLVRLMQIVALVQDGHSGFDLRRPSPNAKDHIPVRFVRYADGVYVRAAAPEYAEAVGGKVLKVGSVGWQEAMARADSVVSHDAGNHGEQLAWSAKTILTYPRLLHGLGLADSADSADFVIEKNAQSRSFHMKGSDGIGKWYLDSIPNGWVDARPSSIAVPLGQQQEDKDYWFRYLPEHHAIYFQFNVVYSDEAEPMAAFSRRLGAALDQPDVQRLVIDLRNNTGGDNTLLRPLLITLIRSKLNHRGGIYAILGPTTFSAAQNFVNRMENYTEVIYVGQPTGENVNSYGDPAVITLPHSQLHAAVSQLWWQDQDPRDSRTATFPEIAIEPSFQEYLRGEDSALQYALTTATPKSIQELMVEGLPGGVEAVQAQYTAFVRDPAHKFLADPEVMVNQLGYRLLSEKRVADAITVFEVNARTHPDSWNAWDSLGEGYANARDKEHALKAYRKSVELNPKNTGGIQMIKTIEAAK